MTNIQFQRNAIDASGAFSSAWEQVKGSYGTYLGASLVAMILISCLSCISWFLVGPTLGGIYYVAARGHRGEPVEFGMMFEGFKKFVPLMAVPVIFVANAIVFLQVFPRQDRGEQFFTPPPPGTYGFGSV